MIKSCKILYITYLLVLYTRLLIVHAPTFCHSFHMLMLTWKSPHTNYDFVELLNHFKLNVDILNRWPLMIMHVFSVVSSNYFSLWFVPVMYFVILVMISGGSITDIIKDSWLSEYWDLLSNQWSYIIF